MKNGDIVPILIKKMKKQPLEKKKGLVWRWKEEEEDVQLDRMVFFFKKMLKFPCWYIIGDATSLKLATSLFFSQN
jgi:hypothetical protein